MLVCSRQRSLSQFSHKFCNHSKQLIDFGNCREFGITF